MILKRVLICCVFLVALSRESYQLASCTYGARGSLMATCVNAIPSYFRSTAYRFDNLDETVQCINCSLQVIDGNTFDISGNHILTLNLTRSQITVLKPKAFIGLVFLRKLYLQENNIVGIPPETFQGINKVEVLNIESNSIVALKANGFKELTSLRSLNLKNNRIKTVEVDCFDGLASLEELDLSNNEISNITNIFKGLLNVGSVNFEGNKIAEINPYDLLEMDVLLYLNLARNNLESIPSSAFLKFPHLETLNLSINPIDTIMMGAFRGLYSLEELDLSKCLLSEIAKGLLLSLHHLRLLDISNNKLTVFATGTYSGLPELRKLNLSHNRINEYKKTGVFPLHSLHTLDLSYNKLEYLDYKLLVDHLPSLARIELIENPLPCYLEQEMDELFKQDNLIYSLGDFNPTVKCNDTRPTTNYPAVEEPQTVPTPKASVVVQKSDGHEYVLYIFICISLGLIAFLFYVQHRNQRDIREFIGKSNISETRLLSHEMEG